MHIRIILCIKFDVEQTRKIFMVKKRKSEHNHWISHTQIGFGTKFQLKLKVLRFWPDLFKKSFSRLKQEKWAPHISCIMLHIQISAQTVNFDFLDQFCPKCISRRKQKTWTSPWNSAYIWISLGTKIQLKLIFLSFWTKFTPKRYFQENRTSSPRTTIACFLCSKR